MGLILNVIDPQIGGVLLTGHQGTGKSTAVRSLVEVMPQIEVNEGCVFSCPAKSKIPISSFKFRMIDSSPCVGFNEYFNKCDECSPSKKIFRSVVLPTPGGPTKPNFLLI